MQKAPLHQGFETGRDPARSPYAPGFTSNPPLFEVPYYLVAGLPLFALNVVFYMVALSRLDLSVAYPIMVAGGIVIVVSVSALLLGEPIDVPQGIGLILLVVGIALVGHRSFV